MYFLITPRVPHEDIFSPLNILIKKTHALTEHYSDMLAPSLRAWWDKESLLASPLTSMRVHTHIHILTHKYSHTHTHTHIYTHTSLLVAQDTAILSCVLHRLAAHVALSSKCKPTAQPALTLTPTTHTPHTYTSHLSGHRAVELLVEILKSHPTNKFATYNGCKADFKKF